jgi:hypothetical protein
MLLWPNINNIKEKSKHYKTGMRNYNSLLKKYINKCFLRRINLKIKTNNLKIKTNKLLTINFKSRNGEGNIKN